MLAFLKKKLFMNKSTQAIPEFYPHTCKKKLVQCGIVPNVLASLNRRFGYRGVVCYLYTNKESKAPWITNKGSILTEIARIAYRLDQK